MDFAGLMVLGARRLADRLLPPLCLACEALTDTPHGLCGTCWSRLRWLAGPCCDCCGEPFALPVAPGTRCADCVRTPPHFRRARAALAYGPESRDLILRYKHADRTEATPAFARWLARAGAELLAECDLIVPVPLHWQRLVTRRYNQAALLARALAVLAGLPVDCHLLVRRRATPSQGQLSPVRRRQNVARAFAMRGEIANQRVLLVDDVFTTGATADACAQALRGGGAAAVDVLCLMRVCPDSP